MRKIKGKLTPVLKKHTTPENVGKDRGYPIKTFRELVEQVAQLSFINKDYLLFYRGQKNDYRNKVNVSTFYPTIYRGDYLTQSELNFRFEKLNTASKILIDLFNKHKIQGRTELKRKKLIQWSILQHYEVTETPLSDVTQSLRVACSFAQLNNKEKNAYIYVFGLPYFTNRISTNSEHYLVNIRLLSITPPKALRPYFQEGFLIGTDDITDDYDNKNELDLNNRLFAKFEIPNNSKFWGSEFDKIPENALYPKNDLIEDICNKIKDRLDFEIEPEKANLGQFLKTWSELENYIIENARKYKREVYNIRTAISILMSNEQEKYGLFAEFDTLRMFRNKLVHNPNTISNEDLIKNINIITMLYEEYKKSPQQKI